MLRSVQSVSLDTSGGTDSNSSKAYYQEITIHHHPEKQKFRSPRRCYESRASSWCSAASELEIATCINVAKRPYPRVKIHVRYYVLITDRATYVGFIECIVLNDS
jgi:hypothetical protein